MLILIMIEFEIYIYYIIVQRLEVENSSKICFALHSSRIKKYKYTTTPLPQSLTFHSGSDSSGISRVSVGTQTSSSPTIEVRPPLLDPQTISIYTSSQMSVVRR